MNELASTSRDDMDFYHSLIARVCYRNSPRIRFSYKDIVLEGSIKVPVPFMVYPSCFDQTVPTYFIDNNHLIYIELSVCEL
jgi:hypothetical protein